MMPMHLLKHLVDENFGKLENCLSSDAVASDETKVLGIQVRLRNYYVRFLHNGRDIL